MRMLFLLALIVVGLVVAGVVHIQTTGNQVQITIDKTKAESAAEKLLEEGKEFAEDAQDALEQARQKRLEEAGSTRSQSY